MTTVSTFYTNLGDRLSDNVSSVASIYAPLNRAIRAVSKRLYYHKSTLVQGNLSVSIAADANTGDLPSDFGGLMGSPYISGKTWKLTPLPDEDREIFYASTYSTPKHYKVLGTTLKVIPGTGSAITVVGYYYALPATLSAATDSIPWTGQLDDVIGEYTIEAAKLRPVPEAAMQAIIVSGVDDFIKKREMRHPTKMTKSVGWQLRLRR